MLSAQPAVEAADAQRPVVVLGGGVGALLLAVRLGRSGRPVTLVERGPAPGGCNGRDGTLAPLTGYAALGLEPAGSLAQLLRSLQEPGPSLPPLKYAVMDHVVLGDQRYDLPADPQGLAALLTGLFPHEGPAIEDFLEDLRQVHAAIQASVAGARPLELARARVTLQRFGPLRYQDYLAGRFADPRLRCLLAVRAFSFDNGALTMLAYLAKILLDGLYGLPDSGASLADALAAELRGHPAVRMIVNAEAQALLTDPEQQVVGVRLKDGETLPGDVVLNIDPAQVVTMLPEGSALRLQLHAALQGEATSLSAITLAFALTPAQSDAVTARWGRCARFWLSAPADPFELLRLREQGRLDLRAIKVHPQIDARQRVSRLFVEIDCLPEATRGGLDGPALARELSARLRAGLPGIEGEFASWRLLTPQCYSRMAGHRGGAASGFADRASSGLRPVHQCLARHGLHQVGQWSPFGSGLSQLETSALLACRQLRAAGNRERRT